MSDNNRFNSRVPRYNDDSNYTTNAPSYYDDLARKNALLEKLAHRIWEYEEKINQQFSDWDNELKQRFLDWDKNLEEFDDEVLNLLQEWIEDEDKLAHIINETIFSWKADKTYVDDELDKKSDLTYVDTELGKKADKTYVDDEFEGINTQLTDIAYNVKTFGAKGDGTTDDTSAIVSAITHIKQNGGGSLYFPNGIYIVDFVLKVDFDLKVFGESTTGTIIKVKDQSTLFHNPSRDDFDLEKKDLSNLFRDYHAVFFVYDCNFEISNITIDGNPENQYDVIGNQVWNYVAPNIAGGEADYYKYYHGIQFKYDTLQTPKIIVDNCHIKGISWNCLSLGNRNDIVIDGRNIEIKGNTFENSSQDLLSIHSVTNLNISQRNKFINPNSHAVHVYFDVSNFTISNNYFELNDDVFVFKPNDINRSTSFIMIAHGSYINNKLTDISIKNNEILNLNQVNTGFVYGIMTRKTIENMDIMDNKIQHTDYCIAIYEIILGKTRIKNNRGTFNIDGLIFRPIINGELPDLNPSFPKPYASETEVDYNDLSPVDENTARNAIDLRALGESTISDTDVEKYLIKLRGNRFDNMYFQQHKTFRAIIHEEDGDWTNAVNFNKSATSAGIALDVPLVDIETTPELTKGKVYSLITLVGNAGRGTTNYAQYEVNVDFTTETPTVTKNMVTAGVDTVEFSLENPTSDFATLTMTISTYTYININVVGVSRRHRMRVLK